MMDGRALFPKGWHPQLRATYPDGTEMKNPSPSRTASGGVRYYFIDFGISSRDKDQVLGIDGQEPAPELSATVPYDPYKLDVYVLGMAYRHLLLEVGLFLPFRSPCAAIRKCLRWALLGTRRCRSLPPPH